MAVAAELLPLAEHDLAKRYSHVTDGRVLTGAFDIETLSQTCLELEAETPGHVCLATLDNLGQADYTSMHAVNAHDLDETEGHDLTGLPDEVFEEDGTHAGYLSTPAEFPIRLANFRAKTFPALGEISLPPWSDDESLDDINRNPDTILDPVSVLRLVPVQTRADAIAAYPNGYFTCDLSPFANHTLAWHLETAYGYQLFGIGASHLAFRQTKALDESQKIDLSRELAALCTAPDRADLIRRWFDRPFLILRYTE